jgi:hypothetical protein
MHGTFGLRYDIQHHDIQHNDTQHIWLTCDTRHKRHSMTVSSTIMLNAIMLSVAFLLLCWVSLCWMSLCWVKWHPESQIWQLCKNIIDLYVTICNNGTALFYIFTWDRCCHLTLCLWLILFHGTMYFEWSQLDPRESAALNQVDKIKFWIKMAKENCNNTIHLFHEIGPMFCLFFQQPEAISISYI